MQAIVEYLRSTPSGATKDDLSRALALGHRWVEKIMPSLAGKVASIKVGSGKGHQALRYFAPEHAPLLPPQMSKPKGKADHFRKQRTAAPSTGWQGEAKITSETKVTICPPFVDRRFEFKPTPGWKGEVTRKWEQERGL
jgi:hypothetical protein